jgi:hypothetical protein
MLLAHQLCSMVIVEEYCARIFRPSFRENKPKTLIFSHAKRAYFACFPENWVYKFGHRYWMFKTEKS